MLKARFKKVPSEIKESVNTIAEHELLKRILHYAACSHNMDDFRKTLSEESPASNAEDIAEMSA